MLVCAPALAGDITFALDPVGGTVSGAPGETIGWGFTLTNSGPYWLLVDESTFVPDTADYTDFISIPFMVIGPSPENDSWTESFDASAQTGAGSFSIDPAAVVGSEISGPILLTYDLYDVDPNSPSFDPANDLVLPSGQQISADAEVDVVAPTSTPEPALGILAGLLCLVTCILRAKQRTVTNVAKVSIRP
jgi:hypothetical protein